MRGKQAKKLRRLTRLMVERSPATKTPELEYNKLKPFRVFSPPPFATKSALFLGHLEMAHCVRRMYQGVKKQFRGFNQFGRTLGAVK